MSKVPLTLKSSLSQETLNKLALLKKGSAQHEPSQQKKELSSPLAPDLQQQEAYQRRWALIKLLCERYPQTFSQKEPKPLKVGIFNDLYEELKEHTSKNELRNALRLYTRRYLYRKALLNHKVRYNLKGEGEGEVNELEQSQALEQLKRSKSNRKKLYNAKQEKV